jgi:hypothetical protein
VEGEKFQWEHPIGQKWHRNRINQLPLHLENQAMKLKA